MVTAHCVFYLWNQTARATQDCLILGGRNRSSFSPSWSLIAFRIRKLKEEVWNFCSMPLLPSKATPQVYCPVGI